MKIKVLLFTGYGANTVTPAMKEIMLKYKGIKMCTCNELIEYVENSCVVYDKKEMSNRELINGLSLDIEKIITFKEKPGKYRTYYIYDTNLKYVSNFSIVEVDTTRPWTIEEYDGSESIKYLDDMVCVDKELNYWSVK